MRGGRITVALIVLVAAAWLLALLSAMLMPFVAGLLIAYFLDPLADRLERLGVSRGLATALITVAFFVFAATAALLLVPLIQGQVMAFAGRVPDYLVLLREQAAPLLERLQATLPPDALERLRAAAGSYAGEALAWLGGLVRGLWSGGVALLNLLSLAVITPVVTFYLLRDFDRIVARADELLPRDLAPVVRAQAAQVDRTLAAWLRGQATVCLILAAYYGAALTILGLEFGLMVGLAAGLISFVPYFGMLVGLGVAAGIAAAQFGDLAHPAIIGGMFAAAQVVDGYFLTPKLVGERIGLHPVWVIFALLAGGTLFGFTGVLLAVPAAAVIGVVMRFAAVRYRASALYRGDGERGRRA